MPTRSRGLRPLAIDGRPSGATGVTGGRLRLLRQHRRHAEVQPVGPQVVVEQAELAVLPELGEQPAALLLPDLPQVVRVGAPAGLVLAQPLQEALGVAPRQQALTL